MSKKDVCIKTYGSIAEAELAKGLLESEGITVHIMDAYPLNPLNYGIKVFVERDDAKHAKEVLDSLD